MYHSGIMAAPVSNRLFDKSRRSAQRADDCTVEATFGRFARRPCGAGVYE